MTGPTHAIVATVSASVILLALSGSAMGTDSRGAGLPRSGGHIEAWYFPELRSAETSKLAAFEAEGLRSDSLEIRRAWAASGLPRSGGHVDSPYLELSDTLEQTELATLEAGAVPLGLPRSKGHVEDWYFPATSAER